MDKVDKVECVEQVEEVDELNLYEKSNGNRIRLLYILAISSNIDEKYVKMELNKRRREQIRDGILCLFRDIGVWDRMRDMYDMRVILVDNTVIKLDGMIEGVLPDWVERRLYIGNRYGGLNKGSGVLEQLGNLLGDIKGSDNVIYFEPRQRMVDYSFMERYMRNESIEKRMFRYWKKTGRHYYTGLFSCMGSDILRLLGKYSPELLAKKRYDLERVVYEVIGKDCVDILDYLGVERYIPRVGGEIGILKY